MDSSASNYIAQGALTNSKRPESFIKGIYPTHVTHGLGCVLYDNNRKAYIDYICGLGTNLFGYANQAINQAIQSGARLGASLSLSTSHEVAYAKSLLTILKMDRLKIFKTGTEGCMAAIKIARASKSYPHKFTVLSEGYHGWSDMFVGLTPPAIGVSHDPFMKKLNPNLDENHWQNVAAVIVEPIITDWSKERIEWLKKLRMICDIHNVALIFDETITMFRFPNYAAYLFFGIEPDIVIGGKALANGLPISVVAGKARYMDNQDYFTSGSYCGDIITIHAAQECLKLIQTDFHPSITWEYGLEFLKRFNRLTEQLYIDGYPTRGVFRGDPKFKALFWQEACKAGILFGSSWFYNKLLHINLDNVVNLSMTIIHKINQGQVKLEGEMPQVPFAQKQRE